MAATIIPFPAGKIHRNADLIYALECLARIDDMEDAAGNVGFMPASSMRRYWERELERLDGVPRRLLRKDA